MIDFPASPTDGQIFSATNGVVYKWSAAYSSWLAQNPTPPIGGTGDFFATGTGGAISTSAATPIVPATVVTGNAGLWYSVSTGRYVPPAGRYSLFGWALLTVSASLGGVNLFLYKNGAQIPNAQASGNVPTASGNVSPSLTAIVDANGSDYFELRASAGVATTCNGMGFGASPLTGMQGPTGPAGVTQTVSFETGAVATGTTTIPLDDTIPQITEGDQYMTLAITPQSATSKLIIEVTAIISTSATTGLITVALFQDSNPNALAVAWQTSGAAVGQPLTLSFKHIMTSGTTSPTTFRLRAGPNASATITFNGLSGTRYYGGTLASSIVIREVP